MYNLNFNSAEFERIKNETGTKNTPSDYRLVNPEICRLPSCLLKGGLRNLNHLSYTLYELSLQCKFIFLSLANLKGKTVSPFYIVV